MELILYQSFVVQITFQLGCEQQNTYKKYVREMTKILCQKVGDLCGGFNVETVSPQFKIVVIAQLNLFLFWIYKYMQLCWQAREDKKPVVALLLRPNTTLHGKLNEATLRFGCTLYSIIVLFVVNSTRYLIAK